MMNEGGQSIKSPTMPRVLLLIMIAAFFSRLLFWFMAYSNTDPSGDAVFYYDSIRSIADDLCYSYAGRPTAGKPPGYPVFAGLILRLFGNDTAIIFLQYLFGVMASLPIFLIARHYLNEKKALLVTLAYLFYPTTWHWESQFMSESLYLWLNNLFVFFIHRYLLIEKRKDLVLSSLWATACFLTRPAAIFPLGIVFLALIWKKDIQKAVEICAVCSIIFGLVLSPWVIRNYMIFGHFIPASTSTGITLYTSYINWGYDMSINNLLPADRNVLSNLKNDFEKDRFLLKRTLNYLIEHPLKLLTLAPIKLIDYLHPFNGRWYPLSLGSKYNVLYGILASFATVGFLWNIKTNNSLVKLAGLLILGGIISAVLFHGEIRYRFVINPLMFLLSGLCFIEDLGQKQKTQIGVLVILNIILWLLGTTIY